MPAKPGLNRFYWDLRIDPTPAVNNLFIIGGYAGTRVVPGQYTLRLSADQPDVEPVEVQVAVKPDPRITATYEDYQIQQAALHRISGLTKEIHRSVNQFRQVKSQLADRLSLLKPMADKSDLVALGKTAMDKINEWENHLV